MGRPLTEVEEEMAIELGKSMDIEARLREKNAALRARLAAVEAERDRLREAVRSHLDADIWGHQHRDNTMGHGSGCEKCVGQRESKEALRAALATPADDAGEGERDE